MHFWRETQQWENRGKGKKPLWKLKRQEEYYQRMRELNKKGRWRKDRMIAEEGTNDALGGSLSQQHQSTISTE